MDDSVETHNGSNAHEKREDYQPGEADACHDVGNNLVFDDR